MRVNEAKKDMVPREEGNDMIIFGSILTYIAYEWYDVIDVGVMNVIMQLYVKTMSVLRL